MKDRIEIVEVGPRDGLQNEATMLTTEEKLLLIDHLVASGVRRIEAVSFAHPGHVPQMADAEAVMAGIDRSPDVSYIGLVMNERGWHRARTTGVDEVNMPIMATETFNRKNQGATTEESLDVLASVVSEAASDRVRVSAVIGVAWGCPFEGEVPIGHVVDLAERVAATGVNEVGLADTIGVGDPWSVAERIEAVRRVTGDIPLRVHFHDTRNTGIANAFAAIQSGITVLDASVGGIGGCPFAPGATGNIATDDLVYMLDRAGFEHGISLPSLIGVSHELSTILGSPVPSAQARVSGFPGGSP